MGKRFSPGRGRRGFTLSEVLIAVAVLVVLAGLAVPNIIHYQRLLNMQALDGYAREIFLVAQNHMTERKGNGTLSKLSAMAAPEGKYLTRDTVTTLMPSSALEGELMSHHFYVTYDEPTGSVLSVTYGEGSFTYEQGRAAEGKTVQERMKAGTWIGYYTGQPAGNLSDEVQLPTPTLTILNGEKLLAQVTAKLPTGMSWNQVELNVAVDGVTVEPPTTYVEAGINTRTYTLVLDSLIPGEQFKDLKSGLTPGEDFKLSVSIHSLDSTVGDSLPIESPATNSLFDAVEGGTAHISYGRHLQNLSTAVSGVKNITAAEQISDIRFDDTSSETDWHSYYTAKGVAYAPIANDTLSSYRGNRHTITGLTARAAAGGAVGMFDHVTGSLEGIYLVNPKMIGTAQSGALAGYSSGNLTISDCRVYHAYTGSTPKEELAGKGYQISGAVAGGLVGQFSGNLSITDSFAATLISGYQAAGGLVGGGMNLRVENSYADCYLSAPRVGGLAGAVDSSIISASYSAGFIVAGEYVAGMVVGDANITNSYAAMTHLEQDAEEIYPMASGGRSTKAHYLPVPGDLEDTEVGEQISSSALMKLPMVGFGAATFASTHPYNLMEQMALTVYPFPKLTTLPHYGDWKAEFESGALVYYEEYADETYGFSGGALNFLKDSPPHKDGYAIAYAAQPQSDPSVAYDGGTSRSISKDDYKELDVTAADDTQTTYYLLLLPDTVLAHAPTEGSTGFYERISTTIDGVTTPYWFNPHFAATVAKAAAGEDAPALSGQVRIRTPRHLYNLSRFSANYASNGWSFQQELALNYGMYLWSGEGRPQSQPPIGTPFMGVYNGRGHLITGISVKGKNSDLGLFGRNDGLLRNVIYDAPGQSVAYEGAIAGRGHNIAIGGLVGRNTGTIIDSVAANLRLGASNTANSTVYLGGLVGRNEGGLIRGCEAANGTLTSSSIKANAYVGAFAGSNRGTISQSDAHGALRVSRDISGTVLAGGFVAANSGSISAAYCAVGIYADGNAAMGAFVAEGTVGANTYYLNDGNYFLNTDPSGHKYSLTFPATNGGARGQVAAELVALSIPGMGRSAATDDTQGNPYPTVLDDGHHGPWLRALDLGDIGVAYWEKETRDGNDEYHFSYLGATKGGTDDPGLKGSLLCTLHDDGGVITDYGYAYYYRNATVSSAQVGSASEIWTTGQWDGAAAQNTEAAEELMKQMGGVYTFVSYNTYDQTAGEGLRPVERQRSGAWPIVADDKTYYYRISPFFAESMEYMGTNSATEAETLGKTGQPYGVRSLRQLQFINWNSGKKNYTTDSDISVGSNPYPYLRQGNNMEFKEFHWLQSHDLQAASTDETETDYQPIGSMRCRFSGYFDGDNYAIRNLSFTSPSRFVGLFGVADGAVLTNIVMHTTQGTSVIRGTYNGNNADKDYKPLNSGVGGLVGFARNKVGKIENCSISDYEIVNDVTVLQTASDTDRTGAATGGLAGWSEVNITACTAITYVHGGGKITATNGGFKVAGLVGASRESNITDCYAGGEVKSDVSEVKSDLPIHSYVVGMVGPDGDRGADNILLTGNRLKRSYSYVKITQDTGPVIKERKAQYYVRPLSFCMAEDSYYLAEMVTATKFVDNRDKDNFPLSYDAFIGAMENPMLNLGYLLKSDKFGTVTTEDVNGTDLSGKYSLASDPNLQGLNYPFPTVLTQKAPTVAGEIANLHYGNWPQRGPALPGGVVELDLIVEKARAVEIPLLGLTENGTFAVTEVADGAIADVTVEHGPTEASPTVGLRITGKQVGFTDVSVTYTENGRVYPLTFEVVVTAVVNVEAEPVSAVLLPGGTRPYVMTATDKLGGPLEVKWSDISSNAPGVASASRMRDDAFIATAINPGDTVFTVTATYTDRETGADYTGQGRASLTVHPVTTTAAGITLNEKEKKVYPSTDVAVLVQGLALEGVSVTEVVVTDETIATATLTEGELTFTGVKEGKTTAELTLGYVYEGVSYTDTVQVAVDVLKKAEVEGSDTIWVERWDTITVDCKPDVVAPGVPTVTINLENNSIIHQKDVSYKDGKLTVGTKGNQTGSATLTLTAKYRDGTTVTKTITVIVYDWMFGGTEFEQIIDVAILPGNPFFVRHASTEPVIWDSPSQEGILAEVNYRPHDGRHGVQITTPADLPPGTYTITGTATKWTSIANTIHYTLNIEILAPAP